MCKLEIPNHFILLGNFSKVFKCDGAGDGGVHGSTLLSPYHCYVKRGEALEHICAVR